MNDLDDGFQDQMQHALNEYKRQELTEKYSAHFSPGSHPDLPPQVEAQWLDYIEEFERQFEHAKQIPLRDFIGSPSIRPLADIPPAELEAKLDQLLDMLAEYGVWVDFVYDVDSTEVYRFITEELLDENIDDIRIPGLTHHFIYEEFHPNDVQDAKFWATEFLVAFLSHDEEQLSLATNSQEMLDADGNAMAPTRMFQWLNDFHASQGIISNVTVEAQKCEVGGDDAAVELAVSWDRETQETDDVTTTVGRAVLRLKRSPYSGWDVIQARFPLDRL